MDPKLVEKAEELGIDVDNFDGDEDGLKSALSEAEKKNKPKDDDTDDVDKLKEKIKFLEAESKKAFESRDAAKKEKRTYQTKLNDLEARLKDSPSPDEVNKIKEEYEELRKFKEEVEKQKEEEELKNKTELERTQVRFEKEFNELKKKMESEMGQTKKLVEEKEQILQQKESEIVSLRTAKLRSEIMEHASKYKAYNPKQIARLLQDDFDYDDKVNSFFYYERDGKGKITDELSIEDRVKAFLGDPENDNLVESTSKSGTNHKETDSKNLDNKKSFSNLNKKEKDKISEKAEEARLPVETMMEIEKIKGDKLKRIREKAAKS